MELEATATETPFVVGQWVFAEFDLQEIKEVTDGRVTEVSDGWFRHAGNNLSDRCRQLSVKVKRISDQYKDASRTIHRDGSNGLNYPDIHRWLVSEWCGACDEADDDALRVRLERLRQFTKTMIEAGRGDSGYGFSLMR